MRYRPTDLLIYRLTVIFRVEWGLMSDEIIFSFPATTALENGSIAVYQRNFEGFWCYNDYRLLHLGPHPVSAMVSEIGLLQTKLTQSSLIYYGHLDFWSKYIVFKTFLEIL